MLGSYNGNNAAHVYFKEPNDAFSAKKNLSKQNIEGRILYVEFEKN